MVIIAFNILTRHLELILTTYQGNGHECVQVFVFPVFIFYFYYFIFYFFKNSEGKEIERDEKIRFNVKDNNENKIVHYSIQFLR